MSDAAPNGQPPRLAFQAFWLLVARTTAFTMTLVLPILLTRLFTENQFGTYRLALVAATTASNILSFNVGMSAFYYLPRLSDIGRRQLIFNIVAYHVMLGTLVVGSTLLWPNMLTALPGTAALAPLTPVVGLMIAFVLFAGFFETIATANQDVWYSTAFIVTAQLTRALMIIGAVFYYRTVSAVLWAWTSRQCSSRHSSSGICTIGFPIFGGIGAVPWLPSKSVCLAAWNYDRTYRFAARYSQLHCFLYFQHSDVRCVRDRYLAGASYWYSSRFYSSGNAKPDESIATE